MPVSDSHVEHPPAVDHQPLRVAIKNIGCKLNLYESEALRSGFSRAGFDMVGFEEEADVYVVNTCTVTGAGDADSRRAVRTARGCMPCVFHKRWKNSQRGSHRHLDNSREI